MAGNEEILMQFRADDQITNTVRTMGTNVLNTIGSIQQAMSQLNTGLGNFAGSVNMAGTSFGNPSFGQAPLLLSETASSANEATSSVNDVKGATDDASRSNDKYADSTKEVSSSADKSADSFKDLGSGAKEVKGSVNDLTSSLGNNTSSFKQNNPAVNENKESKRSLGSETRNASNETREFGNAIDNNTNLMTLSAGSAMYLAGQMSSLGTRMEDSAHNLNELSIGLGQVAKMSGMPENEMTDMIAHISNETFPNEEAVMYTKNLTQMGVESKNFADQATNMDRINDAFGLGAETTNSLAMELSVLGVDANHLESSFNALAYANENTKGGMENYYAFLRKYDSELSELGYDVDQTSIIISAATQKYGGGRAALAGLSTALKDAGKDTKALEQALGLKAGALDHAKEETATYEGQLQNLANEEMEHKTWLDRINAAWDDFTMKNSAIITTGQSIFGLFGQTANIGLTVFGLKEIGTGLLNIGAKSGLIQNTINRMKMLRGEAQTGGKILSSITPADATMMAQGNKPIGGVKAPTTVPTGVGKGANTVAKETTQVVKGAGAVGAVAPEATAAASGVQATSGAMAGISSAFTTMIVPLLAISAVIAVMIPIIAGLVAEALLFLKGIQVLIKSLNFEGIDLTKSIESIKQIGSALWEIGRAMGAMVVASLITTVANVTTFLVQLTNPIGNAGRSLVNVANELKMFNSVNIDKSVPTKIKSITDAMKLISEAMGSLVDIVFQRAWGNLLTLGGRLGNIRDAIREARSDIENAGREIAKIKDIPNLDAGAVNKLKKVTEGIKSISDSFEGLRKLRDGYNWDNFVGGIFKGADIQTALDSVKEDIYKASSALKNFDGVDTIPDGVGNNLKKVADALKSVGDSITTLRKLRDDYNWDEGIGSWFADSDITAQFENVKKDLVAVANSLKSLGGDEGELGDIGKDVPAKIKKVTDTVEEVLKAVESMEKFKGKGEGENSDDFTGVVTTIENAKTSLVQVSKALQSLGGTGEGEDGLKSIGEDVKGKINSVSKTLDTLSKTMNNLTSFPVVSGDEIPNRVQKAVTVIQNSARHLNGLSGSKNVDESVGNVISTTGRYGDRLRKSVEKLRDFPVVSGNEIPNRVQKAVTVIQNSARHLNGLSGSKSVPESVGTVISTTGRYGARLKSAVNKLKGFPVVSGDEIPRRVQKAVTAVKNTARHLNGLKGTTVKGGVGGILSSVSSAVSKLRETLRSIAPGFSSDGQSIGTYLKGGIKTGLGGLSGVVSTAVSSAMRQGGSSAWTGGVAMATSAINGFKSTFLISSVIATEMQNGLTAITTATPDLTNAMGQLAQQMVDEFKAKQDMHSPGIISRSIRDEMIYMREFVSTRGKGVINSVGNLATSIVNTFNPNLQADMDTGFNTGRLDSLSNMNNNTVPATNTNHGNVTININEGAIQLDARNLTTQESRQIIVNAIEGLDVVKGIDVRGV